MLTKLFNQCPSSSPYSGGMDQGNCIRSALPVGMATCLALTSAPVHAQADDTVQGTAASSVVEPVQIVKTADLDFGQIIPNGTGNGRVIINARTGARTGNANVTLVGTTGFSRAEFTVTGERRRFVNLTTSSPTITLTGPGNAMTINRLRVNRNNGGQRSLPRRYRIPNSGTMNIGFGGRLNVATDQAAGVYSGTFDLTVTYE